MKYNTRRPKLPLPEYGREIQEMVNYACTLPTREERGRCASAIVSIMGNMFPHLRDVPEFKHKLWDHLAAMSDYSLDIDYPYEISRPSVDCKPQSLAYPMKDIKYRHYGALIESFVKELSEMPEGQERDRLALMVAGQMRRSLAAWNRDALDEEKVAHDMASYTDGRVQLTVDDMSFLEAAEKNSARVSNNRAGSRRGKRRN